MLRFGLAAWSNRHFDHILYSLRTPHRERLGRYASVFPIAEADVLHHQIPDAQTLGDWVHETPEGFRFLPKMHKHVTHPGPRRQRGRLEPVAVGGVADPLAVAASYLDALKPLQAAGRCGPVLLQYAKDFTFGETNISALGRLLALRDRGQFAVELRHPSWWTADTGQATRDLLEAHGAALVWSTFDTAPSPAWRTADFGYVRFAGTCGKTRDRWVTKKDRLADVLDMRRRLAASKVAGWDECFVIVTNRFEGNAIDSLPGIAAALGETRLAQRVSRAPGQPLLPG